MLDDSVERHQLVVDVIDHLNFTWRFAKQHPCRTGEHLDVAAVFGYEGNDLRGEFGFSAHPCKG